MSFVQDDYEAAFIKKSTEYFKDVGGEKLNEKRDDQGRSAVHLAAGCGNNLPEVKRLLSLGADINSKDKSDNTPLHSVAFFNINDSHFDLIKMLLELKAEVNAQNIIGSTPLHYLTMGSSVKLVQMLLNFEANVNIKDMQGHTPLSMAISFGYDNNLDVLKLLLDRGADVNNLSYQNMTPLHLACASNSFKLVKFLVKNGADVNSLNSNGCTPLLMILENRNLSPDSVRFLIKYSDVNAIDLSGKNILSFYEIPESQKIISKTIVSHIAKLHVLELPIHQELQATILDRSEVQEYFEQCTKELKVAKGTKLKNCWVTFYNLLLDSKRKLKNYSGNVDLVECFKNSDCLNKFPIYGPEMLKKVDKGIETRKSFDKSTVELSYCLPIFDQTHLIIKDVLDCLTFKDYNRLITEEL